MERMNKILKKIFVFGNLFLALASGIFCGTSKEKEEVEPQIKTHVRGDTLSGNYTEVIVKEYPTKEIMGGQSVFGVEKEVSSADYLIKVYKEGDLEKRFYVTNPAGNIWNVVHYEVKGKNGNLEDYGLQEVRQVIADLEKRLEKGEGYKTTSFCGEIKNYIIGDSLNYVCISVPEQREKGIYYRVQFYEDGEPKKTIRVFWDSVISYTGVNPKTHHLPQDAGEQEADSILVDFGLKED